MEKLSPEIRRLIMRYGAKENIDFATALECLVSEGAKSFDEKTGGELNPCGKPVYN